MVNEGGEFMVNRVIGLGGLQVSRIGAQTNGLMWLI